MSTRIATYVVVVAALFALSGCLPPGGNNGNSDAGDGDVEEGPFEVTLGKSTQGDFEAFSGTPTLEVVSGFQGGFHLEPALMLEEVAPSEFFAVVSYEVEDVDSGELLHRDPSMYRVDQGAFVESQGALLRTFDRVILEVNTADDAAGRTVELSVEVELEGIGTVSRSHTVELVDEVNELGG
jgi:hypothetical protein